VPLFDTHDPLHEGLARYEAVYVDTFREHASAKLGLATCTDEDLEHLHALYRLMHAAEMDMTITFRALADVDVDAPSLAPFADAFYDEGKRTANELALDAWLARHAARVRADTLAPAAAACACDAANPATCCATTSRRRRSTARTGRLRRHRRVARRDAQAVRDQPGRERFAAKRPDWARDRAGCSMLSCSS